MQASFFKKKKKSETAATSLIMYILKGVFNHAFFIYHNQERYERWVFEISYYGIHGLIGLEVLKYVHEVSNMEKKLIT